MTDAQIAFAARIVNFTDAELMGVYRVSGPDMHIAFPELIDLRPVVLAEMGRRCAVEVLTKVA